MSPAEQLAKEARYDVIVASVGLSLFLVFGLILPKDWFWYWFAPMAAFWFRYLFVRCARDEALLRADIAAGGGSGAPGCYRSEAGICITDGTHHVLVARNDAKAPLQLTHVARNK